MVMIQYKSNNVSPNISITKWNEFSSEKLVRGYKYMIGDIIHDQVYYCIICGVKKHMHIFVSCTTRWKPESSGYRCENCWKKIFLIRFLPMDVINIIMDMELDPMYYIYYQIYGYKEDKDTCMNIPKKSVEFYDECILEY